MPLSQHHKQGRKNHDVGAPIYRENIGSHVSDVDDSLVAEARGPEINALLLPKLEVFPAALAWQERGEHVLRDTDFFVLQVQPI